MGQLQRKNTRKGARGKRLHDDTVTSQLLEAIFAPHSDRIRAEITKGSPRQVEIWYHVTFNSLDSEPSSDAPMSSSLRAPTDKERPYGVSITK
jgi:hypothetical protein